MRRRGWPAALLLALSALLSLAVPSGRASGQGAAPARGVPVPAPEAAKGAAEAADAAARDGEADARDAVRLTPRAIDALPATEDPRWAPTPEDVRAASTLRVYLMTIGQGEIVWQLFGHNALWLRDEATGEDLAYNWGVFDFAQPNFLGRFLTGDTQYWVEAYPGSALAEHYARSENRSVWVQELALSDRQKARLRNYVRWNALDANKFYRYDYYRDNCSTRVRDALDLATGGAIRRALGGRPTGTSYRSHTRRLTAGDPATYTGIQLALGRPADAPIDAWEESFLPVRFMAHARRIPLAGENGALVPLVAAERQLFAAERPAERDAPPARWPAFLAAGLVLGGMLAALGRAGAAGRRGADAGFGVLAGTWLLVAGLAGTALLLAGTVTRHVFMGRNENLLAVSPLALVLLALLLVAVGTRRPVTRSRWRGRARLVAALLAVLTVVGAVVTLLPTAGQGSAELFALFVPVHVALWWALARPRRDRDGARDAAAAALAERAARAA